MPSDPVPTTALPERSRPLVARPERAKVANRISRWFTERITDDAFDTAFHRFGGRLVRERVRHESAWIQFERAREWMTFALDQTQRAHALHPTWSNSAVGIELGLLASAAPNAMALATKRAEFAGVTAAMISSLQELFWGLGTCPDFLPDLPGGNDVWRDPVDIGRLIAGFDTNVGWGTAAPAAGERRQLADRCVMISELFILFHEVAHLTYGHCLAEAPGAPDVEGRPLAEFAMIPEAGDEYTASQLMELDADEGAVANSLDWVIQSLPQVAMSTFPDATTEQRLGWWALAVLPMFRLFDLRVTSSVLLTSSSHPPAAVRATHAVHCAYGHLRDHYSLELAEMGRAVAKAVNTHLGEVWDVLNIPWGSHGAPTADATEMAKSRRDALLAADGEWLNSLLLARTSLLQARYPEGPAVAYARRVPKS